MDGRVATVVLVMWACLTGGAWAYSVGAPDSTCPSRRPIHGASAQTSPAPYSITPKSVEVKGGQRMLVTMQADGDSAFKGFLIQARASDNDQMTGTFFTIDHKYLNCDNGFNNAITHSGPANKDKVTLEWEPPSDFVGDVVFKGSFVRDKVTFWENVTSEKVTVNKREVAGESTTAPPTPATSPATSTSTAPPAIAPPATTTSSVSSDSEAVGAGNAGDVVISVVDAPSADVVENDISLVGPEDNSAPSSTLASFPTSLSTSPVSLTTTSNPSSPTSESSTGSSRTSPEGASEGEGGTETTKTVAVQDATERQRVTQRPSPGTTRRKFGLLGRFKTTEAPTSTTTTEPPTTPAPRVPSQDLSPEEQNLERDLVNIYDDCELTKGCFGYPAGCEGDNSCDMMMTYSKAASGYKFEIMGNIKSGYVATGLSDDEKMGTDSVMACRVLNGEVDVVMAFNKGKSNELLANRKYGLSDIKTLLVDGKVYCTFIRQARTEITAVTFDLDTDSFHLMLATGPAGENALLFHDNRIASSGSSSMDKFEYVGVSDDLFKTLHACFMIGAWICAASSGIIFARYYKTTWLRHRCCNIDQWFHFHRLFMGLTWGLTVAGFILIVYYLKGWTEIEPSQNPHAILGVISTGLCFIQPFMALCRCAPTSKRRPIFNWLHWFVGNCAQILGITAIFFGFPLIGAPEWTTFILIIFIAFHCIVHLILSVGQCVSDSKAERMNNIYPMKEMNGSRNPLHPVEKRTDSPGAGFRKAMLGLYFFINWLITAVLIIIVVIGEETLKDWGIIFWEK